MEEYEILLLLVTTILSVAFWLYMTSEPPAGPPENCDVRVGRRLGNLERFFLQRCARGNALLGNMLLIGSKQPIKEFHIRKALKNLMHIHPLLRMRIQHINNKPWFKPLENFEPPLIVSEIKDWVQVFEKELLFKFGTLGETVQWRVTYLPNARVSETSKKHPFDCVLIFTFNHTIIDGISYMWLFNALLDLLSFELGNEAPKFTELPLLPPIDSYLIAETKLDVLSQIKHFILKYLSSLKPLRPALTKNIAKQSGTNTFVEKFGTEKQRHPNLEIKSCIIPTCLSTMDTSLLISQCRKHGVTVQSAVQAAASFAVSRLWDELTPGEDVRNITVHTGLPMNLRNEFKYLVQPQHLGCYFLPAVHEVCVPPQPIDADHIWSVASEIRADIKKQLKKKKYMWFYKELCVPRAVANITCDELDYTEETLTKTGGRYPSILLFSNKGNCSFIDRSEDSPVKLLARYGGSGEHLDGPIFDNDLVTFEGKLFWTVLYFNHVTSREITEKYIKYTMENIKLMNNTETSI